VFERCKRCAGDEQEVVQWLFAQLQRERRKREVNYYKRQGIGSTRSKKM
jgi:hypothetical protein